MASDETTYRSAVADWLYQILPSYAAGFADNGVSPIINWQELLRADRLAMYSTGERYGIALAAMLEDRQGVVLDVLGPMMGRPSLLEMIGHMSKPQRRNWLSLLIHRVEQLPD